MQGICYGSVFSEALQFDLALLSKITFEIIDLVVGIDRM